MRLRTLFVFLLLSLSCFAQRQTYSGSISAAGTDCLVTTAACLNMPMPANASTLGVTLSGTFTGTAQFEATTNSLACNAPASSFVSISAFPVPNGSAVTSATSGGTWTVAVGGFSCVHVRASAYSAGPITASATAGIGSAAAAGADTQVQFNDGGAFGGDALLRWLKSDQTLIVNGATLGAAPLQVETTANSADAIATTVPAIDVYLGPAGTFPNGILTGLQVQGDGNGAVDRMIGVYLPKMGSGTTGTTSQLGGMYVGTNYTNGASVTRNYGVEIDDQHGVGTTNYALHIFDQGSGASDYAIKVDGGQNDLGAGNTKVGSLQLVTGSRPSCDAAHKGTFWYVAGATNVADTVAVCAKDGSNVYDWRTIY